MKRITTLLIALPLLLLFPAFANGHKGHLQTSLSSSSAPLLSYSGRIIELQFSPSSGKHASGRGLVADNGFLYTLSGQAVTSLQPENRVTVRGRVSANDNLEVLSVKESKQQSSVSLRWAPRSGKNGVMIVYLGWEGAPAGNPSNKIKTAIRNGLTNWSAIASGGLFSWTPITFTRLSLPKTAVNNLGCLLNHESAQDEIYRQLEAQGYNLFRDYRALALVDPPTAGSSCNEMGATATVDKCIWGTNYYCNISFYRYERAQPSTFRHELGHSLGLNHANSIDCQENGKPVVLTYREHGCQWNEYRDFYDIMGNDSGTSLFGPIGSDYLGWLPPGNTLRLGALSGSGARKLTIGPYGLLGGGTRVVQLNLPVSEGRETGSLYLAYRAKKGLDSMFFPKDKWDTRVQCSWSNGPGNRLFVYWSPTEVIAKSMAIKYGYDGNGPLGIVLDTTPGSNSEACDAGLGLGKSWTDPSERLTITFTARAQDLSSATFSLAWK